MTPEMTRSLLHETSKALADSVANAERLEKQNTRLRAALQQIADHKPDRNWSEMGKQCIIDGMQDMARAALSASDPAAADGASPS